MAPPRTYLGKNNTEDEYTETSSKKHMLAYNNWSFDGGENIQQSSSSDGNQLAPKHPPSETSSVQEVFISGDKSSPKRGHLKELDRSTSVSRYLLKSHTIKLIIFDGTNNYVSTCERSSDEDETETTTSECSATYSMEKTPLKSSSARNLGLIDEVRQMKAAAKKKEETKEDRERRNNSEQYGRKSMEPDTVDKC